MNVPNEVTEGVTADVKDRATTNTIELTREEVERAVSKLKNGKASIGSDEIVAEVVGNGGQAIVDWSYSGRCGGPNKFLKRERMPSSFHFIRRTTCRKACDNYYSIALLSVSGKVLSLILLGRLQAII